MGTRHLTIVKDEGKTKVAQYGQWDGYPEGQGATILDFLNKYNLTRFREKLGRVRFLGDNDKAFLDEYNKNAPTWSSDPDNRTEDQIKWFKTFQCRDIGAKILQAIMDSDEDEVLLTDSSSFKDDGLYCEWCYTIDFDKGTFEVWDKEYPLDKLPTVEQVVKDFTEENE